MSVKYEMIDLMRILATQDKVTASIVASSALRIKRGSQSVTEMDETIKRAQKTLDQTNERLRLLAGGR